MTKSLVKILQSQGMGSRRECTFLIRNAGVTIGGEVITDPQQQFATDQLRFVIQGDEWVYREKIYLALNKPVGLECSHAPRHHDSVFELFPEPFLNRGLQAVGRLDVDTAGLLLLSDDGEFIHRITSPRRSVQKQYRVAVKHPFSSEQAELLTEGVELNREKGLFRATGIEIRADREIDLTIDRGCYHQVKRMIAAVSNRVESLDRIGVGQLRLESLHLERGQWVEIAPEQVV